MAGYSGTPLPQKLGFKPGTRYRLVGAPPGYGRTLGRLPAGCTAMGPRGTRLDLIQLFVSSEKKLERHFGLLARKLQPAGALWISWPKKSSGVTTDLTETEVRRIGLAAGLVDVKVCAVDETWSGLKFVRRLKERPD
ncbi:MAG TPA: hypothetical protein VKC51_09445 [Lacunisphaera sp.]|nr:hypothetical protein [Lacunisphaera sp.]